MPTWLGLTLTNQGVPPWTPRARKCYLGQDPRLLRDILQAMGPGTLPGSRTAARA